MTWLSLQARASLLNSIRGTIETISVVWDTNGDLAPFPRGGSTVQPPFFLIFSTLLITDLCLTIRH